MKRIYNLVACLCFVLFVQAQGMRQVHLDFHTSEEFPTVGNNWNKAEWQANLKRGHVNSINIFAKGHHGWCYYDTKEGKRHPKLKFDLLKSQIEACHEIGVSAQAYVTVGWSVLDAHEHPEWVITGKDGVNEFAKLEGTIGKNDPFPWGFPMLMPEGGYLELLEKQTEEIAKNYDVDGFWFDIIPMTNVNYNAWSKQDMAANGIDWRNDDATLAWHFKKLHKFFSEINAIIKKYKPNATIYYNWTTPLNDGRVMKERFYDYNTQQDLEDLPTTWAGYDVFPLRSKFYANTGKPIIAMSGKFHSSWGEFGGFKHKNAILYEACNMIAFGAGCNFGDQLHPTGRLEKATYDNIGYAYKYIEQMEPYCKNAVHKAKTGVWINFSSKDNMIAKLLLEGQFNFVVANNLADWSDLTVLVLHSGIQLNDADRQRIEKFVARGGKLLLLGKAATVNNKPIFDIGADTIMNPNYRVDYTYVSDKLSTDLVQSPFLNRNPAYRIYPKNVKVLAQIYEPYWDRTVEHWTSHDNTPYKTEPSDFPAVIRKGNIMWCAHELEYIYDCEGSQVHKQLFINMLRELQDKPYVAATMPSCGRLNLMYQKNENRYIVHLTYGTPLKRGKAQVIDDLVPLYNVPVEVELPKRVTKAYIAPTNEPLKMERKGNKIKVVVPQFTCHTAIVFE